MPLPKPPNTTAAAAAWQEIREHLSAVYQSAYLRKTAINSGQAAAVESLLYEGRQLREAAAALQQLSQTPGVSDVAKASVGSVSFNLASEISGLLGDMAALRNWGMQNIAAFQSSEPKTVRIVDGVSEPIMIPASELTGMVAKLTAVLSRFA